MPYVRVPKLSGSHPQVLANAVQVRLMWQLNGVNCCNVLGGRVAGGWTNSQTHADDLAAAIEAAWTASGAKARCPTSTYLQGTGIRDIRNPNLVEYEGVAGGIGGTSASDALPNQIAAVITLRTAFAGKSFRGRVYFSGADEAQNDGSGHILPAYNTALVAFMTGIQSAMADEGITLAVLSHKRYANLPPPADVETWAGAVNDVTSIQARDVMWDTQRRRRD